MANDVAAAMSLVQSEIYFAIVRRPPADAPNRTRSDKP